MWDTGKKSDDGTQTVYIGCPMFDASVTLTTEVNFPFLARLLHPPGCSNHGPSGFTVEGRISQVGRLQIRCGGLNEVKRMRIKRSIGCQNIPSTTKHFQSAISLSYYIYTNAKNYCLCTDWKPLYIGYHSTYCIMLLLITILDEIR